MQQSEAWIRAWGLLPAAVRNGPLTHKGSGGPLSRVHSYLAATVFDLLPRLYNRGEMESQLESFECEQILHQVQARSRELVFATECVALAKAAFRDLTGKADDGDRSFAIARGLLVQSHLTGEDLELEVRNLVARSLGFDSAGERVLDAPYTPTVFKTATKEESFVETIEGVLGQAWANRSEITADPPDLNVVASILPLNHQGYWVNGLEVNNLAELWTSAERSLGEILNVDHVLRRASLADELVFTVEGHDTLLPPPLLGTSNEADAIPLDQSIQARCARIHKSASTRKPPLLLGTVATVANQVARASAEPFALSSATGRLTVLLAQAITGMMASAALPLTETFEVDADWRAPRVLCAAYKAVKWVENDHISERGRRRASAPAATFIPLVWLRMATAELGDALPESPEDVWVAIRFAWNKWIRDIPNVAKKTRSGVGREQMRPSSTDEDIGYVNWLDWQQLRAGTDPSRDLDFVLEDSSERGVASSLEDLLEYGNRQVVTAFLVSVMNSQESEDDALAQRYSKQCLIADEQAPIHLSWPPYTVVAAYIRTHLRRP